ncbi:MAG: ATP citrate synthase [Nanoarchaeota archaeon]|nr:ATP citrate synthase [Nanoarchaeota archaeon]
MENYQLFNKNSQTFFYNLKEKPIQSMLDFDFLSKRTTPSISAIIHPGRKGFQKFFFGNTEILIPIYPTIKEATTKHPTTDSLINFASFRSAYLSSKQALETKTIKTITIVAEGIPERQTKQLIALAKKHHKTIIGPSTVGGIIAGKFRIGHAGGTNKNIIRAKLYRPGSVGLVSKSGGLMNEFFNIIARTTDGIHEGIAIGGDVFPGSTLLDHILRFEINPNIKLIIAMSELGGRAEYDIIQAKQENRITKPLIIWCSGTCAKLFPFEVQFGHAGAKAGKEAESAQAKNQALREAGIIVPNSFEELETTIQQTHEKNKVFFGLPEESGNFKDTVQFRNQEMNEEIPKINEQRKATHFTNTISNEKGDELTYNNIPISKIIQENKSIGDVLGLLWFKKQLPAYFTKFLETAIMLTADHGPAVSGAHNSIVAARAGKDIISSLCSGLLTIGPKFGGAIDDASRYFKEAADNKTPIEFVQEMKNKNIYIPGIGHRVKSKSNPDKRVKLLKGYAQENFPTTNYLNYALEVEKITLEKAENLILNVDGCLGVLFLDALDSSNLFTTEEIDQIINIGYLNGLFALARSIGFIGHILDQKRLGERMYRHPTDDILYTD